MAGKWLQTNKKKVNKKKKKITTETFRKKKIKNL